MRLLGNKVLVKRNDPETKTEAGLYIPDTSQEKPVEGTVFMASLIVTGVVNAGDKVLFGKYSGVEVLIDGTDYILLDLEDIFVVL